MAKSLQQINLLPNRASSWHNNRRQILLSTLLSIVLAVFFYQKYYRYLPPTEPSISLTASDDNSSEPKLLDSDKKLWSMLDHLKIQQRQALSLFNVFFDENLAIHYRQISYANNQLAVDAYSQDPSSVNRLMTSLEHSNWQQVNLASMQLINSHYQANIGATSLPLPQHQKFDSALISAQLLESSKYLGHPVTTSTAIQSVNTLIAMHHIKLITLSTSFQQSESFKSIDLALDIEAPLNNILLFIKGLTATSHFFKIADWSLATIDNSDSIKLTANINCLTFIDRPDIERLTDHYRSSEQSEESNRWLAMPIINLAQHDFFAVPNNAIDTPETAIDEELVFNLVGTMQKQQQRVGFIESADGEIHTLTTGDFLPHSRAIVTAINHNQMIYTETKQLADGQWHSEQYQLNLKTD